MRLNKHWLLNWVPIFFWNLIHLGGLNVDRKFSVFLQNLQNNKFPYWNFLATNDHFHHLWMCLSKSLFNYRKKNITKWSVPTILAWSGIGNLSFSQKMWKNRNHINWSELPFLGAFEQTLIAELNSVFVFWNLVHLGGWNVDRKFSVFLQNPKICIMVLKLSITSFVDVSYQTLLCWWADFSFFRFFYHQIALSAGAWIGNLQFFFKIRKISKLHNDAKIINSIICGCILANVVMLVDWFSFLFYQTALDAGAWIGNFQFFSQFRIENWNIKFKCGETHHYVCLSNRCWCFFYLLALNCWNLLTLGSRTSDDSG